MHDSSYAPRSTTAACVQSTRRSGNRAANLVLLLAAFIVIELLLQLASLASVTVARVVTAPAEVDAVFVPDDRLLYRGNPLKPDHDAAGYRNEQRPRSADIVVLGDSQTYGPSDPHDAWPRILSGRLHRTVYNMALPGYGPGQSLLQLADALSLRPTQLIEALYVGNDFHDAFLIARRHPELAAGVPAALGAEAEARETEHPFYKDTVALFTPDFASPSTTYVGLGRLWISQHLKLYGLLRAVKYRVTGPDAPPPLFSRQFTTAAAGLSSPRQREFASIFDGGDWRTILTAPYRARPLDDRDPRIRMGLIVAQHALSLIQRRCRAAGVDFLVVHIPTKESVFWPRVSDPAAHPGLQKLVTDEAKLKEQLTSEMRRNGIASLDLLDALRSSSVQPYFEDADSHPNAAGHRVIAARVAEYLARRE